MEILVIMRNAGQITKRWLNSHRSQTENLTRAREQVPGLLYVFAVFPSNSLYHTSEEEDKWPE